MSDGWRLLSLFEAMLAGRQVQAFAGRLAARPSVLLGALTDIIRATRRPFGRETHS